MAPSGVDKGQVPADQLIVVDGQAKVLTGKGKASAETEYPRDQVEVSNGREPKAGYHADNDRK